MTIGSDNFIRIQERRNERPRGWLAYTCIGLSALIVGLVFYQVGWMAYNAVRLFAQ